MSMFSYSKATSIEVLKSELKGLSGFFSKMLSYSVEVVDGGG